jgi:hypothetical protein
MNGAACAFSGPKLSASASPNPLVPNIMRFSRLAIVTTGGLVR